VRAVSLALGNSKLLVDNWFQISSDPCDVLPIALMLQYEHITLMT